MGPTLSCPSRSLYEVPSPCLRSLSAKVLGGSTREDPYPLQGTWTLESRLSRTRRRDVLCVPRPHHPDPGGPPLRTRCPGIRRPRCPRTGVTSLLSDLRPTPFCRGDTTGRDLGGRVSRSCRGRVCPGASRPHSGSGPVVRRRLTQGGSPRPISGRDEADSSFVLSKGNS